MDTNKPVSNYDLLKRIENLEDQLKQIVEMFEQGKGVLTFVKWIGSIGVSIAIIFGTIHNWWSK